MFISKEMYWTVAADTYSYKLQISPDCNITGQSQSPVIIKQTNCFKIYMYMYILTFCAMFTSIRRVAEACVWPVCSHTVGVATAEAIFTTRIAVETIIWKQIKGK